jgi:hypothetical protein
VKKASFDEKNFNPFFVNTKKCNRNFKGHRPENATETVIILLN